MSVVVAQPAQGEKGSGMPMMAMQPMSPPNFIMPQGLPPGLAYLGALSEVLIHQHFDTLEGKVSIIRS